MTNYTPSNDHPSYNPAAGTRPACGKAVGPLLDMVACVLPVGHEDDCEADDSPVAVREVEASYARETDTGVEGGVDVDVSVTLTDGTTVEGSVTLVRDHTGEWSMSWSSEPAHWIEDKLLRALRRLDGNEFRRACDKIEAEARAVADAEVRS